MLIGIGIVIFCVDVLMQIDISSPFRHRKFPLMVLFIGGCIVYWSLKELLVHLTKHARRDSSPP
jgi:hypothetical protein